ncbi:MAG: hypothetical protein AAGF22_03375 [Pseudomonadota bacterium]
MPLQNRVHPDGTLCAVPERGTLMGNRGGRIHTDDRTLGTARWRSRQWISCVLAFKNRQREVMGPYYTELFFLDEVTALAAGHRPCFECRRAAAVDFATRFPGDGRSRAPEMDRILHAARLGPKERARLTDQPFGTLGTDGAQVYAHHPAGPLAWSFNGYTPVRTPDTLTILTPEPIRAALSAGYAPQWHPSAPGS